MRGLHNVKMGGQFQCLRCAVFTTSRWEASANAYDARSSQRQDGRPVPMPTMRGLHNVKTGGPIPMPMVRGLHTVKMGRPVPMPMVRGLHTVKMGRPVPMPMVRGLHTVKMGRPIPMPMMRGPHNVCIQDDYSDLTVAYCERT
ncbi:hypothetical protein KC318_g1615 [Hortaea werneckii]|nr:hypothetical protein KC334_g7313 [Hortaea werneckii]KAI7023543.1 hypothetical protein KC355_g1684 [Hortaea werneckii]KAI7674391.1 hypothetical protein KC318_g1615 [Hortaea werneckii]